MSSLYYEFLSDSLQTECNLLLLYYCVDYMIVIHNDKELAYVQYMQF
jgi:hypothetical protein